MIDHKELMKQGQELIAANLAECCREELEWQNTALLCDGKMREAGAIYAQVDSHHALSIVQSEVARQAMQVIAAAPQVVADESKAVSWLCTDLDGRCDVGVTKEIAKHRAGHSCNHFIPLFDNAPPVQAQEPVALPDGILATTIELARCIWRDNYKNEAPDWEPLTDLQGVLSQIDNMVCGMRRAAPVQPVAVPCARSNAEHELHSLRLQAYEQGKRLVDDVLDSDDIEDIGARLCALTQVCTYCHGGGEDGDDADANGEGGWIGRCGKCSGTGINPAAPEAQGDAKDAEYWREARQAHCLGQHRRVGDIIDAAIAAKAAS